MITRLWIKNFGPYEGASLTFEDFTVILGANGSGKSLLFSALRSIGRVVKFPLRYDPRNPSHHLGGYPTRTGQVPIDDILHRGDTNRTLVLGVEFDSPLVSGQYEVHLKHWQNPGGTIVEEQLSLKTKKGDLKVVSRADGSVESPFSFPASQLRTPRFISIPGRMFKSRDPEESALGEQIQQALWDRIGVFRFDPTALKVPAEVGRKLSPTGYNFANFLDEIRNEPGGTADFEALLARFKAVCPHVEEILLPVIPAPTKSPEPAEESAGRKRISLALAAHPRKTIPADLESDGTILLLAYASLLHGSRPHDTICIEEPENGVHPKVVPQQVQMFRELTKPRGDRPGAQVLVCTHSRPFFDAVSNVPSALRLVRRGSDGRSTVEGVPAQVMPSVAGWAGLT
jgi:predicted ATPase